MNVSPPTRFARPLEGALPVARQSRFHGSRLSMRFTAPSARVNHCRMS